MSLLNDASFADRLGETEPIDTSDEVHRPRLPAITPVSGKQATPVSFNQEQYLIRKWLSKQQCPDVHRFRTLSESRLSVIVRLSGNVRVDALERALNEILRRHEVLRTAFSVKRQTRLLSFALPFLLKLRRLKTVRQIGGAVIGYGGARSRLFRQRLLSCKLSLRVVDLRQHSEAEQQTALQTLPELIAPFDLSRPPFLRAALAMLSDRESVLSVGVSHMVFDPWSEGILRRELSALYDAFSRDDASPLSELPIQYGDFSAWERNTLKGSTLARYLDYWQNQLPNFSYTTSPLHVGELSHHRRANTFTFRALNSFRTVDNGIYHGLQRMCANYGVTMYILLLTAIDVLLHRLSGKRQIATFVGLANRTRPEVQDLIGWFAQWHLLCIPIVGDPTFSGLLHRVRSIALGAIDHQEMPLALLAARNRANATGHEFGLPPHIAVEIRSNTDTERRQGSNELRMVSAQLNVEAYADYALRIIAIQQPKGMGIGIVYSVDWFTAELIRDMHDKLHTLFAAIVRDPNSPISAL